MKEESNIDVERFGPANRTLTGSVVADTDRDSGSLKTRGAATEMWLKFRRSPLAIFGGTLLLMLVIVSVVGPAIWPLDPLKQSLAARNKTLSEKVIFVTV